MSPTLPKSSAARDGNARLDTRPSGWGTGFARIAAVFVGRRSDRSIRGRGRRRQVIEQTGAASQQAALIEAGAALGFYIVLVSTVTSPAAKRQQRARIPGRFAGRSRKAASAPLRCLRGEKPLPRRAACKALRAKHELVGRVWRGPKRPLVGVPQASVRIGLAGCCSVIRTWPARRTAGSHRQRTSQADRGRPCRR